MTVVNIQISQLSEKVQSLLTLFVDQVCTFTPLKFIVQKDTQQQSDQGSAISELNEVSVSMGTSTTISVQDAQKWGQNTSLGRACVGIAYI